MLIEWPRNWLKALLLSNGLLILCACTCIRYMYKECTHVHVSVIKVCGQIKAMNVIKRSMEFVIQEVNSLIA